MGTKSNKKITSKDYTHTYLKESRYRAKGGRAKYKYRKTNAKSRKESWLFYTDRRLSDFSSIKPAVKYLLKDERNYKNVVKAIEEQNPGFFTDLEFNENLVDIKTDKDKAIEFITNRLKAARDYGRKRGYDITVPDLIKHEFQTEAYMSRERRIAENLNKMYGKRIPMYSEEKHKMTTGFIYKEERELFKRLVGTTDLTKRKIDYLNELPSGMPYSAHSMGRGYVISDENGNPVIIFEMVRDRVGDTEYTTNLVTHYLDNGRWKKINHKTTIGE